VSHGRRTLFGRRAFVAGLAYFGAWTVGAGMLATCSPQPAPLSRKRKVGYLSNANAATDPTQNTPSLSRALRDLGYVEGRDLTIETRLSEGVRDRLPALAAELVALRVDVVVTTGGPTSALAAKGATNTIPIVFTGLADPVGAGLVSNLARPGGNLTGVVGEDVQAKRLELLRETVPGLSRVAILFNEKDAGALVNRQAAEDAARELGVGSVAIPLNTPDELDVAVAALSRERVDGLVDTHGGMFYGRGFASLGKLLEFAVVHRLPQTYNGVEYARAGGLMALGQNTDFRWQVVARLVDRILKGANPGDLPVEVTNVFQLALNLPMARKIGLTFPESVLRQATEIIQ
jgi:putative ABC transport system substrate-binding protein